MLQRRGERHCSTKRHTHLRQDMSLSHYSMDLASMLSLPFPRRYHKALNIQKFHETQVLSMSIWTYRGPPKPSQIITAPAESLLKAPKKIVPKSFVWLPILALYTPVHTFLFFMTFTFCILPTTIAAAFWTGFLILYYTITSQGNPQHTGMLNKAASSSWFQQGHL